MASPDDRKYTNTHEWIKEDTDKADCGYTTFGTSEVGTITDVTLPVLNSTPNQYQVIGDLTGSTTVDLHAPVGGTVIDRNERLFDHAGDINSDPWNTVICTIKPSNMAQFNDLMTAAQYDDAFPG
jgi:glycine cleavage system H protein